MNCDADVERGKIGTGTTSSLIEFENLKSRGDGSLCHTQKKRNKKVNNAKQKENETGEKKRKKEGARGGGGVF